jgi:radical SAM superfamily enzyme YgiQ (UPF0313 family)
MKIFLGDLVHTWEKVSLWTVPLNIGFIGAYAKKYFPEAEIRLFKRPELLIEALKAERPDVVGLSNYVWNLNLNHRVGALVKELYPATLLVGGGPVITNLNANEKGGRWLFSKQPELDAYILNQGERGFTELLHAHRQVGGDLAQLKKQTIPGVMLKDGEVIRIGASIDPLADLDEIPSPYLSGMLDSFLDQPLMPLIETNRSCPYRCTFCAWGIGAGKLTRFGEERVKAEIEYIAKRCKKAMNLFIVDANFGILERDREIAAHIHACHEKYGFPGHVGVQWNKNRPDRVLEVAKEFRGLTEVGASMQSLEPAVLEAVKRKNLPLDSVISMTKELAKEGEGVTLFTELIVGLPMETWQSHINANKQMIDLGAELFNYNLHLLPGTEMESEESREKYFRRTGWRLHDNAFGLYEGAKVFEGQEVVLETSTMSMEELRSFRFIHFLIQFMWSRKWFYDLLNFCKSLGCHPVELIVSISRAFPAEPGPVGETWRRFKADHDLESFASYEALCEYWSQPEPFERLRSGDYGKLNYQYTYEILLGCYNEFVDFLRLVTKQALEGLALADKAAAQSRIDEILRFTRELRVHLDHLPAPGEAKTMEFSFDILGWRKGGHDPALLVPGKFSYEFFLEARQESNLRKQLGVFESKNVKLTLRKMSEEMSADDFFYRVRRHGEESPS